MAALCGELTADLDAAGLVLSRQLLGDQKIICKFHGVILSKLILMLIKLALKSLFN